MSMNIVYFVKDSSLWRRVIAPDNYNTAGCPVPPALPWQQPSCNPTFMIAQPGASTFCRTQDAKLIESVDPEDFIIEYFNAADATIANAVASSDPDPAVRNTALQSATTINAALTIDKTAAGRTISQSGAVRVTRLDINSSTIAPVVVPTTPVAPVVSSSLSQPASVVFTWPTVPGATGYSFKYNSTGGDCNSGSWTTAFSNQNTTTYTATGAHNSVIYGCATAANSAGTSGWSNMAFTSIPLWASPVLQNNWSDYGNGYAPAAYTKTSSGLVVLKGMVKSGSGTIFTLPTGYRPATSEYIMFENSSNQTMGRVDVTSSGSVAISVGSNAWYSLDGIAFMPSGASFTNFSTFYNSWVNYSPSSGDTNWANASYLTDSAGRVITRGLVRAGNSAGGTPIANLPAGSRPAEYLHVVNVNSNANNHISIDTSGNILAKGGSNIYLALQAIFFPSSRTTGSTCTTQWCNLTLQNSWIYYGAPYATPQYTKASDGMVHVKGLIRSGNTAATIATLPAEYCPTDRLLLTAQAADAWSRIDIVPQGGGGCTITPSAVSATWTSLDNIKFIAEQ